MLSVGIKELLEAGVHFGHQTKRWNPKMKQFIFDARNGIHIIDLSKTLTQLQTACDFLSTTCRKGGQALFVGTKKQAQEAVKEAAKACAQHYVTERWLGGTLTNFNTAVNLFDRSLEMSDVQTLEQLQAKQRLTFQAFAELEQSRQFFGNLGESYRKELTRYNLEAKMIDAILAGTGESIRTKQGYLDQETAAIMSYGENVRHILSLLASNWGAWEFSSNNNTFRFSDARIAFAFRTYSTNVGTAIKAVTAAEQELLRSN